MPILGIDATPNPNAAKITFAQKLGDKAQTFTSSAAAEAHPVAKAIFSIEGVASVFMVNNFATVTKKPDASWDALLPKLQEALANS